ncbi:MAG: tetratricopeptide repeat protein [Alphaproteobacteria bacterium]|nr:tetratricopeptide repeat protein [Alphaproteobacteria bacterium]
MSIAKHCLLAVLCAGLAACAVVTPEDEQMSLSLSAQGRSLLQSGKASQARDIYLSAVARNDANARAWNGLGVSYNLLGKRAEAREAYMRALSLMPENKTAANNLAHLYLEEGKPEEAVSLLKPLMKDVDTPVTLKRNYALAVKQIELRPSEPEAEKAPPKGYAELGTFPTAAMAQGRILNMRSALSSASALTFTIEPVVKIAGGTPVFVLKATSEDPGSLCRELNAQAFPCTPHAGD